MRKTNNANKPTSLVALGKTGAKWAGFETFPKPANCKRVVCVSDEVTANCPVTGQPDWYVVTVDYVPDKRCVESKSLKLGLQSFRNDGLFCEAFADRLCDMLYDALLPDEITVTVKQKPRGGVSIESKSRRTGGPIME